MTSALFQGLFDLETAIEIRRAQKRFIELSKTLNFLCISKVLAFLNYILSLAKARDKIKFKKAWTFSIKRKFLSQNFIKLRTNKNDSVTHSYYSTCYIKSCFLTPPVYINYPFMFEVNWLKSWIRHDLKPYTTCRLSI